MRTRKYYVFIIFLTIAFMTLTWAKNAYAVQPKVAAGYNHTVGLRSDGTVVAVGNNSNGQCNVSGWTNVIQVTVGWAHTVGLRSDGTVVAVGNNGDGQCNVSGWSDIVQVAAGFWYTVGLKSDGTVVAVGNNTFGQCDVDGEGWSGIVQVASGSSHTVALKADGTVVAVGYDNYSQCNVIGWSGIVQVAAGNNHTVGRKSDGTVAAVGLNNYSQCNVSGWNGITQVAAGNNHTVGRESDGTVAAVGDNSFGQCNVAGWSDIIQVVTVWNHTVGLRSDGTFVAVGDNSFGQCNVSGWSGIGITEVAAGDMHTAGLKSDGTVVAAGVNSGGKCNVSGWSGITQIAAGDVHTVGLKSDGRVVAVGDINYGTPTVIGWSGITQAVAGGMHTVGLKSDGTVVAVGWTEDGQCDVSGWSDITQVAGGYRHTVALKSDGTVVAVGDNSYGQCDVSGWSDITQIVGGCWHTVGLKSDGTVVAVGSNGYGECNVASWSDIIQVSGRGGYHTVGLKSDGTVVATGWNAYGECDVSGWSGITQVSAGGYHTVGLKSDGTVVATGRNTEDQCNVGSWNLFATSISPISALFDSSGGEGSVSVSAGIGSTWMAVSSDEWITITSGESGMGNGTVSYSLDINDSANYRMGTITVADKTFIVEQAGANGGSWHYEDAKLIAADGAADDNFGYPVSVDGDVVVVGAWYDDNANGTDAGAAYIYRWNGSTWVEEQKLTASDGAAGDYFGDSISMDSNVVIMGAWYDDNANGTDAGAAYIYRWNGSTLVEEQKLTASDGAAGDIFGNYVSISGNIVIIAARGDEDNGTNAGAVYIYRWNGSTWVEEQKLTASDGAAGDNFGSAISVDGNVVIVGAWGDDNANGTDAGAAYIYRWNGTTWVEEQKLTASDGAADDYFGYLIDVDGNVVIVGADSDDDRGSDAGAAYVYRWNGITWVEEQKLTASDGAAGDYFGDAISVDGNVVVVGVVFGDTTNGTDAGAAYVYRWTGGAWVEEQKLTASDGAANDVFGSSVSVSGNVVVVGANGGDKEKGINAGAVYIFQPCASINTDAENYDANGGTGSVSVTADSTCPWSAVSNDEWIIITSGNTGMGNGTVSYSVDATTSAIGRMGTITIAGETFIVDQSGVNLPPIADTGPDRLVDEEVLVTLDGSGSTDPDGTIASWRWTQTGGPAVTFSDPLAISPAFISPVVGPDGVALTFELTVTDDEGLQGTDTCIVNVSNVNLPPTADAGADQLVDEGKTVTLDGRGSTDADGTITLYQWTQTGGAAVVLSDPTSATPVFTAPFYEAGANVLTFILTVEDDGGLLADDAVDITVVRNYPPAMPLLTGPEDGAVFGPGEPITLTAGEYADPEGDSQVASLWCVRRTDHPACDYEIISSTDLMAHAMIDLPPGLQYAWKVGYKDAGSSLFSWSEEWTFFVGPPVVDTSVTVPTGTAYEDYRMVSFSVWPDDPAALSVFGITPDTTELRIAGYDPTLGTGGYREYGNPDLFINPGSAYWFLVRGGITPAIGGIAVSLEVDIDIPLLYNASASNGWNMIAPPNNADYKWEDIQVLEYNAGGTIIQGPIRIGDLSYENTMIDKRLWRWESGTYYSDTAEMEKYAGYWLKARASNVWLRFPADAHLASVNITKVYVKRMMKEATKLAKAWGLTPSIAIAEVSDTPPQPPGEFAGGSHFSFSAKEGGGCFITTTKAH